MDYVTDTVVRVVCVLGRCGSEGESQLGLTKGQLPANSENQDR